MEERRLVSESYVGAKLCQLDDLVLNRLKAHLGVFARASQPGLVSPDYTVLRPLSSDGTVTFLEYVLKSLPCRTELRMRAKGLVEGFWRLYTDDYYQIKLPVPPITEQAGIVRFLDHVDARIRRYIRAKQKLIKLLEEQKQAIICRAVTRGLDPNVQRKRSGVIWVEDVPAHWNVVALKRVLRRLVDCEHKTAPAVDTSEYRVIRTSAIRHGRIRWSGTYCTTPEAFSVWTQRGVPEPGDVIFTREAPAGEACVVPGDVKVCLGQRTVLMKLRRDKYDPEFLVHMIYAGPPRIRIQLASQGSTVGHFNMDDIGWMHVLAPPLEEQRSMVAEIKRQTSHVADAGTRAEREVDLLREYRMRLVADVVTGKLDVRDVAAGLPEDVGEPDVRDEVDTEADVEPSDDLDAVEAEAQA
jgi:type I restriction enzyme S subunit